MVKTKILLVEDDKSLREIYGVRLYSEGYDIISAGDGEEALAMAIKERPTLIISDVMMPKISGFDMLDILRSTTETKSIKVIMMTALSSEDQRARGEALGADRYLVKSQVGIEDVVRTVHEVLGDAPVSGLTNAAAPATPLAIPAAPSPAPAPEPITTPIAPAAPVGLTMPTPAPVAPGVFTPPSTPATPDMAPLQDSALPQPTAPFSTNRPASLGDRVIHPLESSEPSKDFGAMMNAELNTAPQPNINPVPQTAGLDVAMQDLESLIPPIPATSLEQSSDGTQAGMPVPGAPTPSQEQPAMAAPEYIAPTAQSTPEIQLSPSAPEQPAIGMPAVEPSDNYTLSTLPPEMSGPAPTTSGADTLGNPPQEPTGMSFEETPYAPNPVISSTTPVIPAPQQPDNADEPPIVIPPRPNPGVYNRQNGTKLTS